MKIYFRADADFGAEDLDDAFVKLAVHFLAMQEGLDETLEHEGDISVKKLETKTKAERFLK